MTCRWCSNPPVTVVTTVERGAPGQPIGCSYLCHQHDVTARSVGQRDRLLRRLGRDGIDVIVADLTEVTAWR